MGVTFKLLSTDFDLFNSLVPDRNKLKPLSTKTKFGYWSQFGIGQ